MCACLPPVYFSPQQVGVVTSRCWHQPKVKLMTLGSQYWLPVCPSPTSNRAFVECSSWHEAGSVTNCIRWILEMKFQFDDLQTSNLLVLMVHSKQHFLSQSGPQKHETERKRFDDERQTTVYVPTSSPASDLEFSPSSHLLSRQNKWLVCLSVCLEFGVISDTNPLPR